MATDNKETLSVIIYLYNKFDIDEAKIIFGDNLGEHLFTKFVNMDYDMGKFIASLDDENYDVLIKRACSLYHGRNNR